MSKKAVVHITLVLGLAIVGLLGVLGALSGEPEAVLAAPHDGVLDSAVQPALPERQTGAGAAPAPAGRTPLAPLSNGGGSGVEPTSVVTVCSAGCPYTSIQAAVGAEPEGALIKVAAGTYTDDNSDGYVLHVTKTVTIRGGYATTDWTTSDPDAHPTYLDGENANRVVHIIMGIDPVIEGFHIHSGSASLGGGVYVAAGGGSPVVRRNRIYDNDATNSGGGVYVASGSAVLENNLIYANTATDGGGVYLSSGSSVVRYNTFYDNQASQTGGGIYFRGTPVISSSIVVSNVALVNGGGIFRGDGSYLPQYNDVWGNLPNNYGGMGGSIPANDISFDPLFQDAGGADFRLQGGSECIDRADPTAYVADDYDGYARPFGARADIGAHEFYTGTCFARVGSGQVYTTVQAAVDSSAAGDLVKVAGVCLGVEYRGTTSQTVYINRALTLRGGYTLTNWNDPDWTAHRTVLDAQGQGRGVLVWETEATVEGFDVRNGFNASAGGGIAVHRSGASVVQHNRVYGNRTGGGGKGAGIYINDGTGNDVFPTVQDNEVYSNTAASASGGGIYVQGDAIVAGNRVHSNSADNGGGVYLEGSGDPTVIQANHISTNTATNNGGGIYVNPNVTSRIWDNDVCSNTAATRGGGIFVLQASVEIEENRIYDNYVSSTTANDGGGGVYVDGVSNRSQVRENEIYDNRVNAEGGGLCVGAPSGMTSTTVVEGNAIHGNLARGGGGLHVVMWPDHTLDVRNNLFYTNTAEYGGGLFYDASEVNLTIENNTFSSNRGTINGGGIYKENGGPIIRNNIVVFSTMGAGLDNGAMCDYCDVYGNVGGDSNGGSNSISQDPLFVNLAAWDFHLQDGSPCEDTADPDDYAAYDYDGRARFFGAGPDMGAYERYTGDCFARLDGGQVYPTVQAAVVSSTVGSEIHVAGTCQGAVAISHSLSLRGGYSPTHWTAPITTTTLQPAGVGRVIYITGTKTSTVTIGELIVRDGSVTGDGAGIYVAAPLSPTIQNVVFYTNAATGNGGGFAAVGGNPRLYNNTFVENAATGSGGGIYFGGGAPVVSNTIVVSSTSGGGIYAAAGSPSLAYNNVWQNTGGDYGGTASEGTGDIHEPPSFVNVSGGDFHLQPGSPAIQAGDPNTGLTLDFEGDARPISAEYDIGADEAVDYLGVQLGPDQYGTADPNQVIEYTHYLTNSGTLPDSYLLTHTLALSGTGSAQDWGVGYESVYTLSAGSVVAVPVAVSVPADADSGTQVVITLTASSQSSPDYFQDEAVGVIDVSREWGADLTPASDQKNANPGTVVVYVHTLTNLGNAADTFTIDSSSSNPTWVQVSPAQVSLGAGFSAQIYVTVTLPGTAAGGAVETTVITATSDSGPASASAVDRTTVNYVSGERYVATWGTDTLNNCRVMGQACRSVGHAVSQASNGDTIKVAEGAYPEHDVTINKPIYLLGGYLDDVSYSTRDPDVYVSTIDAGQQGRVLYIFGNPTVEGFTLQNGQLNGPGGGVYIVGSPVLRQNRILSNTAAVNHGGGVYNASGSPTLERNRLENNTAGLNGGGFYNYKGDPVVRYNVFQENTAAGRGGGFYNLGNSGASPRVWSNVFDGNTSGSQGAGFHTVGGSPLVWHNTFHASGGDGVYVAGGLPSISNTIVVSGAGWGINSDSAITVDYNDVWQNASGNYGSNVTSGSRSLSVAPLFLDAAAGDFHLREDSPCIDAGDGVDIARLPSDLDGQPRWMGAWPDMGVDEFQYVDVAFVPPTAAQVGAPYQPLTYTHELHNLGNYTDTFELTWENELPGWDVTLNGSSTQPVSITLGQASTATVHLRMTPTNELSGTTNTTVVTATSLVAQADPGVYVPVYATAVDTTTVGLAYAVSLEPDRMGWGTNSGTDQVVYVHTLTNTGNYADLFTLSISNSGSANCNSGFWDAGTVLSLSSIGPLNQGMTATVRVTITIPNCAAGVEANTTTITATSDSDPSVYDTATDVTVANWDHGLEFEGDNADSALPGQKVYYTHLISNTGNYTDSFRFSYASSRGWPVEISPWPTVRLGGWPAPKPPGYTATVRVTVTVPAIPTAFGGDVDRLVITATSESMPTLTRSVVNTTTVTRITNVSLAPSFDDIERPAVRVENTSGSDKAVVFTHTLTNQGNGPDTFTLTVASREGWLVTIWPTPTVALPAATGNVTTVLVTLFVPSAAANPTLAPEDLVVASAIAHSNPVISDTVTDIAIVNQRPGVALSAGYTETAAPGLRTQGWVTFAHTLTNTGNYTDSFLLTSDQWGAQFGGDSTIDVPPDGERDIWVRVPVPYQECNTTDETVITATSSYSSAFQASALDTTIVDAVYGVELTYDPDGPIIRATSSSGVGGVASFQHTVENLGNCSSNISLLGVQADGNLTPTVQPANVNLSIWGSARLTVTVDIAPTDQTLWGPVVVTASVPGGQGDRITDTIVVNQVVDVSFVPDGFATTYTGGAVSYVHTLTNEGTYTDTFDLSWWNEHGWLVSAQPDPVQDVGPGASRPVTVWVTVPADVYTTTNRTWVTATTGVPAWDAANTQAYTPTAAVIDTTTVRRPHATIEPPPGYTLDRDPGIQETLHHTLTNDGGVAGNYGLTYTLGGWITVIPTTGVSLQPGERYPFTASLVIPPATWGMTAVTIITATDTLSGFVASAVDMINVPLRYDVDLYPAPQHTSVEPPAVVEFTHTLENIGNYTTTYMLSGEGDFSVVTVQPSAISLLPPGGTRPVTVTVEVPPEAAAGDVEQARVIISFANEGKTFSDTVSISHTTGTRYVAPTGFDERNNCTNEIAPCRTLQHAVGQASHQDEIRVAEGVYYGALNAAQVVEVNKSVILTGGYRADDYSQSDPSANQTLLNGQGVRRVVLVSAGVTPTIQGFHLVGGRVTGDGAGLYVEAGAVPTVTLNVFYDNLATGDGGGVYYGGGGAFHLERNEIYTNTAARGGGVYLAGGEARVWNNLLYDNTAETYGGGLCNAGGMPQVWNNTFYGNRVRSVSGGGGLANTGGTLVVSNTIVAENSGGGIAIESGALPLLAYNDVWGNTPAGSDYICTSCTYPTDISADPKLADPQNDDLHLTQGSPCIDAGDPNSVQPALDYEGNSRPIGSRHDIGAYEYGLGGSKAGAPGTVGPGEIVSYTIRVDNNSSTPQVIPVSDTLRSYMTYVPGSLACSAPTCKYITTTRTVEWNGTVSGNDAVTITFQAVVTGWLGSDAVVENVVWIDRNPAPTTTISVAAVPNVRYVAPDGADAVDVDGELVPNGCNFDWLPCQTVQRAVDQAVADDTIWVAEGVYTGTSPVAQITKAVTLIGGYRRSDWSFGPQLYTTTLDGGVVITGSAVRVVGFDIVGGADGVRVTGGGDLTLERAWVYDNTGDGVDVDGSTYALINTVLAHNGGWGLRTTDSDGVVIHTTLARNAGGGARVAGSAGFTNTIFYSHTVGVNVTTGSTATLEATLWHSNTNNVEDGTLTIVSPNITQDPVFVNPDGMDYHIDGSSPAIDAGVDAGIHEDIDGDRRPILGGFDIGADEYPLGITKLGPPEAIAGETITYTLYLNAKDSGLVITDVLPLHLTHTPGTDVLTCTVGSCGYLASQNAITWTGSTVSTGEAYITYTARITSWLAAGTVITNDAQLRRFGSVFDSTAWETVILPVTGTRYVVQEPVGADLDPATGTGNNCLRDWKPCATVQYAVDQAQPHDTVKVVTGVYTDVHTRAGVVQNVYISKSVTILGGYTTANWLVADPDAYPTALNAEAAGRVLYVAGPATVTVDGFSLFNGLLGTGDGGAVYAEDADLTLARTRVYSSQVSGGGNQGGGIAVSGGSLSLVQVLVYDNRSNGSHSGGVYCNGCTINMTESEIYDNWAGGSGGGFYLLNADAILSHVSVHNNTANNLSTNGGGGGYVSGGVLEIEYSEIYSNETPLNTSFGGGLYLYQADVTLSSNQIYGNMANDNGGGLFVDLCDRVAMDANLLLNNTAGFNDFGGGLYFQGGSSSALTMTNNIVAANQAGGGDGLYIWGLGVTADLRHNTIADNDTGEGLRVGSNTAVAMVNTILAGHATGIRTAAASASVTADYTLWDGSGTYTDNLLGGTIDTTNDLPLADPLFMDPTGLDYHIQLESPAVDTGTDAGLTTDVDGDMRPSGYGFEVGADELRAELQVIKTADPVLVDTGIAAAPLAYTIRFTNTGQLSLKALVTDTLPAHVTPAGPLTWDLTGGEIPPDGVWEQTFTVTVDMAYVGPLTNVVEVWTAEGAQGTYTLTTWAQATSLEVSKSAEPDPIVEAGSPLTYTIRVSNTGSVYLHAAITDTLPDHVTPAPSPLTWTVVITPYTGWMQEIVVTVDGDYDGPLVNRVEVTTEEGVSGSAVVTTTFKAPPTLSVVKTSRPAAGVMPGEFVTYTLVVSNAGPGAANSLLVSDVVPAGTSYQSCAGGDLCSHDGSSDVVTWGTALLPAYQEAVLTFTVQVDPNAEFGTHIVNQTYGVTCAEGITATGTPVSILVGVVGGLEMSAGYAQSGDPGTVVVYTHRVTNTANVAQAAELAFDSSQGWATVTPATTAVLDPDGGWTEITVTVTLPAGALVGTVDTTVVTATGVMTGQDTTTDVTTVSAVGGVELSAGGERVVNPGTTVTYTHRVTNTANVAQAVNLTRDSSQGWATVTPATTGVLAAFGGSAEVVVTVIVPTGATSGTVETTLVTAAGVQTGQDTATDVTRVVVGCIPIAGADFSFNPLEPWVGDSVTFNGTVSSGSEPITYTWDFDDGSPVQEGNPIAHTFPSMLTAQTYQVVLTVANPCSSPPGVSKDVTVRPRMIYLPLVLRNS